MDVLKEFLKKNWKDVLTVTIAVFSLLISVVSYKQVSLDRINQVSIDLKNNRVFSGTENIQYDVTLHNGSDLTIYNVTVATPENIVEMHEGIVSLDKQDRPRGIYLGDIAPRSSVTRTFVLKNSEEAQLGNFYIEFMSVKNFPFEKKIWWNKKVGNPPEELNVSESQFSQIVGVTSIREAE